MQDHLRLNCVVASVGLGLFLIGVRNVRANAQAPLDPNAFASLASLTGATNYVFQTGGGSANGFITPTVTLDGTTVISGVIFNGIAVFDFSSITLNTGTTVTASGALPLAILSRGGATLNGSINVGGNGVALFGLAYGWIPGPGGGAGGVGPAGIAGSGPGGGVTAGAGGGFGGSGGSGVGGQTAGGASYGNPDQAFSGGSGGADRQGGYGGGSGGALEISALGDIAIGGIGILDNGGPGNSGSAFGAGAGSGGGIFIATPGQIDLTSVISANGGAGGTGTTLGGGGGGGGRILLETSDFVGTNNGSPLTVAGGVGGAGATASGTSGGSGSVEVTGYVQPVPEPTMGAGVTMLVMLLRRRKTGQIT